MQPLTEDAFVAFENVMETACDVMLASGLDEAGPYYEEFVQNMRAHAMLHILIDARPEKFFQDLITSAFAWRHYLQRCADEKYRDYLYALSRYDPFFDAIAGDHVPLALELIDLGPADWMKGEEYEEDFCWVRFVGTLARHGNSAGAELDALLDRFETALQGVPSGRLEVCRALRAADRQAFDVAFDELVHDWKQANEDVELRAEEEIVLAAGTQMFIEGLAVLRLADKLGIAVTRDYPGCPPLARRPRKKPPIEDPFAR